MKTIIKQTAKVIIDAYKAERKKAVDKDETPKASLVCVEDTTGCIELDWCSGDFTYYDLTYDDPISMDHTIKELIEKGDNAALINYIETQLVGQLNQSTGKTINFEKVSVKCM